MVANGLAILNWQCGQPNVAARLMAAPVTFRSTEPSPDRLEAAARTALERRAGRKLSDAESRRMRTKLLEFISILRAWDQQVKMGDRADGEAENFAEVPCQRER
jgi:hypothetical protein